MINIFRRLFSKPIMFGTERHNQFMCYLSFDSLMQNTNNIFKEFYDHYNWLIGCNMYDTDWDEKVILEEIFKKLILVYGFSPTDKDIMIIKDPKRIYLPNWKYVDVSPGGIFVYNKSKIKVFW